MKVQWEVFTKDCIKKSEVKNIQYYEDHIEAQDLL